MKRALLCVGMTLASVFGLLSATAPAAEAATHHYCPSGWVCVYAGTTDTSSITYKWFYYGTYNIYNQTHRHLVVNAQYSGAFATAYSQYGGHGRILFTLEDGQNGRPPRSVVADLGPVYSFKLTAGPSCWPRCS